MCDLLSNIILALQDRGLDNIMGLVDFSDLNEDIEMINKFKGLKLSFNPFLFRFMTPDYL
jgi:hypothetical protein